MIMNRQIELLIERAEKGEAWVQNDLGCLYTEGKRVA